MNELKITGRLEKVLDATNGETKNGGTWVKQCFIVKTENEYNNLFCFELFGEEKIQNFLKYNKVGGTITVDFNVNCNEYQGKYYTTLSAWRISQVSNAPTETPETVVAEVVESDLPF